MEAIIRSQNAVTTSAEKQAFGNLCRYGAAAVAGLASDRAAARPPVGGAVGGVHLAPGVVVHKPLVGVHVRRRRRRDGDGDGVRVLAGGHFDGSCRNVVVVVVVVCFSDVSPGERASMNCLEWWLFGCLVVSDMDRKENGRRATGAGVYMLSGCGRRGGAGLRVASSPGRAAWRPLLRGSTSRLEFRGPGARKKRITTVSDFGRKWDRQRLTAISVLAWSVGRGGGWQGGVDGRTEACCNVVKSATGEKRGENRRQRRQEGDGRLELLWTAAGETLDWSEQTRCGRGIVGGEFVGREASKWKDPADQ